MATRTSNSSPCFLRVAEASAASSASNIISLSTPFSLETASTAIKISLFIILSTPRSLRPQSRLLNSIERQAVRHTVDFHHNRVGCNRLQDPDEASPAVDRQLQLHRDPRAAESLEVRSRAQNPVKTRRRDFQRVVPFDRIFSLEQPAHRLAHARAIIHRDPTA